MDTKNPVIKLCTAGAQAEFEGQLDQAQTLYRKAWEIATDDYEACIAAHYIAHCLIRGQQNPEDILHWNQEALARADAVGDERVQPFYPSLYVNLGRAYEMLGKQAEAKRYYKLAADLGLVHPEAE